MYHGRIVGEVRGDEMTEQAIMKYATTWERNGMDRVVSDKTEGRRQNLDGYG